MGIIFRAEAGVPRGYLTSVHLSTSIPTLGNRMFPGRAQGSLATKRPPKARGPGAPPFTWSGSGSCSLSTLQASWVHIQRAQFPGGFRVLGKSLGYLEWRLGGHGDPGSPEGDPPPAKGTSGCQEVKENIPFGESWGCVRRTVRAPSLASASAEGGNLRAGEVPQWDPGYLWKDEEKTQTWP